MLAALAWISLIAAFACALMITVDENPTSAEDVDHEPDLADYGALL
jgi:hypothetical protein